MPENTLALHRTTNCMPPANFLFHVYGTFQIKCRVCGICDSRRSLHVGLSAPKPEDGLEKDPGAIFAYYTLPIKPFALILRLGVWDRAVYY
jgi:hypothetical protein